MRKRVNNVSQEYIQKVTDTGSLNEKVKLYLRDHAGKVPEGTRFFMTFGQVQRLMDSVSPQDVDEWTERITEGLKIEQSLTALQGVLTLVRGNNLQLSTLVSIWSHMENTELMVNSLIESTTHHVPTDSKRKELRDRLVFESMIGVTFNMCAVTQDEDGFVEFDVSKIQVNNDVPLLTQVRQCQRRLVKCLQVFKTRSKVIRETIQERKFNVPEWEYILDKYETDIDIPMSPFPKYAGVLSDFIPTTGSWRDLMDSDVAKNLSFPAMGKTVKDYDFSFRMKDIPVDEEEYKNYKKIILL